MVVMLGKLAEETRMALLRAPFVIGAPYDADGFLKMYGTAIKFGLEAYGEMLLKDGRGEMGKFLMDVGAGIDVEKMRACAQGAA